MSRNPLITSRKAGTSSIAAFAAAGLVAILLAPIPGATGAPTDDPPSAAETSDPGVAPVVEPTQFSSERRRKARTNVNTKKVRKKKRVVRPGAKVILKGSVTVRKGTKRKVVLRMKTRDNGWQKVRQTKTNRKGRYSFRVPTTWYNNFQFRVFAPPSRTHAAARGPQRKVRVRPAFKPLGGKSHWARLEPSVNVRWNPCRPIRYLVRGAGGYSGSEADIHRALAEVSVATGLRFVNAGGTAAVPFRDRHPRGIDLLIGWAGPSDFPAGSQVHSALSSNVLGLGGSARFSRNRVRWEYFDGHVLLNSNWANHPDVSPGWTGPGSNKWGVIMVHEVLHAIGLAHVNDAHLDQIMQRARQPASLRMGAGDLAGSRFFGAARGCTKKPLRGSRAHLNARAAGNVVPDDVQVIPARPIPSQLRAGH